MAEQEELEQPSGLLDPLRDPLGMVRRRWRRMLLVFVLGLTAAAALAMTRPARYRATATVLVTTQQIREDLVPSVVQDDLIQRIDALVGSLLARDKLAQLVERHGAYPELRDSVTMDEIVELVRADIRITPALGVDPKQARRESARLFRVSFEADAPEVAAAIANDLADSLTEESIRTRTAQTELATSFLRRELDRTETALGEQSRAIRGFNERYRGELPGELPANLARLERLQQQRQSLALQIAQANTQLAMLASSDPAGAPTATPEARLAGLRNELRIHRGVHTDRHPDVQALERRIEALEAVEAELAADGAGDEAIRPGLIGAAQQTVVELRAQLAQTERELSDLDTRVARTPARQEELAALEEVEGVLRENYRSFLRKVQNAELAANLESAQQGTRFSVIDRAVPPAAPTSSRFRYAVAGALASLAFAVAVGLAQEIADPVLVSPSQVESISGLRVLGTAPHIS